MEKETLTAAAVALAVLADFVIHCYRRPRAAQALVAVQHIAYGEDLGK